MLGRDAEWRILREAIDAVRSGAFRVAFIVGEAGIGKTRLVEEALGHAAGSGLTVFAGRAEDLDRMRPFGAIRDGLARFGPADDAAFTRIQQLFADPSKPAAPVEAVDAFVEFVEEQAIAAPTCLVLEDLHWADADTISAVRAVCRRVSYLPIMVIGTHRPFPQAPELLRLIDLAVAEGATVLDLHRLHEDAVQALVRELIGADVGPRLASMLEAVSGNPLYAAEFVRALEGQGSLSITEGVADAEIAELPPTLRLTILRRLSQFRPDALATLKSASVLGSSFQLQELAVLSGKSPAEIADALEEPLATRIVRERDGRLAFRHDLIHEAIYEDIPAPIRASMHADAVRALRATGAPGIRVAEHVVRGLDLGDTALLDEVIPLMGELRLSAPLASLALGDKALSLGGIPEERRDEVRRLMIWPLAMTGRRDDARRVGSELLSRPHDPTFHGMTRLILAMALAEDGSTRDAIAELEALIPEVDSLPWLSLVARTCMAAIRMRSGIFDQVEIVEGLHAAARDSGDAFVLGVATGTRVAALISQACTAEAVRESEAYLEMESTARSVVPTPHIAPALAYQQADRLDDARRICGEGLRRASEAGEIAAPSVYTGFESYISFLSGAWQEALENARLTHEHIRHGNGSPVTLMMTLASMAQISLRRGDIEDARRRVADAERLFADKGPQWGLELVAWTKALCLEAAGDSNGALNAFGVGWDATAGGHHLLGRAAFGDLVRIAVAAGDRERALRVTEEAEEGGRRASDVPSAVATALRCRGLLEDDPDRLVAAVESYRSSPRVIERAAACEDAGLALLRRGDRSKARAFFDEAIEIHEEVGASGDSSRLLAAMRSAGLHRGARGTRRRATTGWEALTDAERQVARLTVEGLTNPKIAERLYVSKYTVQSHLSHIFTKLQISSRAELAALAARRGATTG